MSRHINHQAIELLAPAGTFDIFEGIIEANCDAVYFGGQVLNMRMIRKGYNFSNDDIKKAIAIAHNLGKKVYITVNNLLSHTDLQVAKDYLLFLNDVQPDGLIIQDLAVLQLTKELSLTLPLHASVMMNVHNLAMIQTLKEQGISRVVLSREMSLDQIKYLKTQTDMEIEYFTHGDMCITHGSQCHYSGMLFGMSSNRGRCLKPCRWDYLIKKNNQHYQTKFPLAVKDMCMYPYLPEMIDAGIDSFKIEGRMRQKAFIVDLINRYGDAIDRYINDPTGYDRRKDYKKIVDTRKRDLSTNYAFGKPGLANINQRYEGTGKFYSTGKVFSAPTEEPEITDHLVDAIAHKINGYLANHTIHAPTKYISVKVGNMEQGMMAIEKGVNTIYLSGDIYRPHPPFTKADIQYLTQHKGNSRIILGLPKMMGDLDMLNYKNLLDAIAKDLDGVLITHLGSLPACSSYGLPLIGDYSLNIYNHKAAAYYKGLGLAQYTVSIESNLSDILHTSTHSTLPSEIIVHGQPCVMYMEHDLFANTKPSTDNGDEDTYYIEDTVLHLVTPAGEYPVYKDQYERCHMLPSKEICLYPILPSLEPLNIMSYRIEGMSYTTKQLAYLIDVYQQALHHETINNLQHFSEGHTLGALSHL